MNHFDEIRAQLRSAPQPSSRAIAPQIMGTLAFAAILAGAIYYLFLRPVIVPLRPSAALPTFHRINPDGSPRDVQIPLGPRDVASSPAQYAGLSYRQTGTAADVVCFARAQARVPHWSKTPRLTTKELVDFSFDEMPHFNELMTCLLTEAPIRYCSRSQRSMIDGEIDMYFRGIAAGNAMLERVRGQMAAAQRDGRIDGEQASENLSRLRQRALVADPRVIGAIEARLRDSTLRAGDRDTFSAAAPQTIRQRLANVSAVTQLCPVQPWWAFWRGL